MSINFEAAIRVVLQNEGGLTEDHAGITNMGITPPTMLRWLQLNGEQHDLDMIEHRIRGLARREAIEIYRTLWWDAYDYDNIDAPVIAVKIMDMAVNMGPRAHRIVQQATQACGQVLTADGRLGPISYRAINASAPSELIGALRMGSACKYRSLAANNPTKYGRFLNGWLRRAHS